ncbi:E6 protein [Human papillomavirus type 219]|uniref:Protein E6 n=1 Tax=Human papillomavirus type 219 TaxID=2200956 RepID=A0A2S1ZRW0_9PAPI|nr:E6 protein [Human papillomavirus type 219]
MAERSPTRLHDLCARTGCTLFNLRVPCIFCKFILSVEDLVAFITKNLSLIDKNNVIYACCVRCLQHCARYEREQFGQCIVNAEHIDVVAGKPLLDILIRCLYCYNILDAAEKIDCRARNQGIVLVRGHWRTGCRLCCALRNEGQ